MTLATAATTTSVGDLATLLPDWDRSLRAAGKQPKTIKTYLEGGRQLLDYLRANGMPSEVAKIRREHVEAFIISVAERWKPATANNLRCRRAESGEPFR
jgi:hypothetical protein